MSTNGRAATNGAIPAVDESIADDLRHFLDRMAEQGIHVRVPAHAAATRLPTQFTVEGESLSDTVVRMRRGVL